MKSILSLSAAFILAAAFAGCSTSGSMKTGENGEACASECSTGEKSGCCSGEAKKEGGCCSEKKAAEGGPSASAVNAKCPYSNNPVNTSITADYKGRTVGFCCGGCVTRWNKEIDADRDSMLAKVMAN
jgi:hypothetical protein